jgi:universal stress protein A
MKTISHPKQRVPMRRHINGSAPVRAKTTSSVAVKRILVPVDFSEPSMKALPYALSLARQFRAELFLVHIVEQIVYPGDWMIPPFPSGDFASESREQLVEKLRNACGDGSAKITPIVRFGRAWQEVVAIAREQDCDMIVLATHGYTGLKHVLLGSVAEKIVRHSPCPVLTVRPDDMDSA